MEADEAVRTTLGIERVKWSRTRTRLHTYTHLRVYALGRLYSMLFPIHYIDYCIYRRSFSVIFADMIMNVHVPFDKHVHVNYLGI